MWRYFDHAALSNYKLLFLIEKGSTLNGEIGECHMEKWINVAKRRYYRYTYT